MRKAKTPATPAEAPKPVFDVAVERPVIERMTVSVAAANDKEAKAKVMAMEKIKREAGWIAVERGAPKAAKVTRKTAS
jgi:hypothetical protein